MAKEKRKYEPQEVPYGSVTKRDTTGEGPRRKVSDEVLAKYLEKSGGFASVVAKQLGMSVWAVCKRIKNSPMLQETVNGIKTTMVDIAESTIVKAVKEGDITATIFTLKCLGKERGWVEKQSVEVDHVNAKPPVVFSLIAQEVVERAKADHAARTSVD